MGKVKESIKGANAGSVKQKKIGKAAVQIYYSEERKQGHASKVSDDNINLLRPYGAAGPKKNPSVKSTLKKSSDYLDEKKVVSTAKKSRLTTGEKYILHSGKVKYAWTTPMQRVHLVREGIQASTIEDIGNKLNQPLNNILLLLKLTPATYRLRKEKNSKLNNHGSELVILMAELIAYGVDVFNNEDDKFQHWLSKPNKSLGSVTPLSLLDTASGIAEVKKCLDRIESGNFA